MCVFLFHFLNNSEQLLTQHLYCIRYLKKSKDNVIYTIGLHRLDLNTVHVFFFNGRLPMEHGVWELSVISFYALAVDSSSTTRSSAGRIVLQAQDYSSPLQPICLPRQNGVVNFLKIPEAGLHSNRLLWLPRGWALPSTTSSSQKPAHLPTYNHSVKAQKLGLERWLRG